MVIVMIGSTVFIEIKFPKLLAREMALIYAWANANVVVNYHEHTIRFLVQ